MITWLRYFRCWAFHKEHRRIHIVKGTPFGEAPVKSEGEFFAYGKEEDSAAIVCSKCGVMEVIQVEVIQ